MKIPFTKMHGAGNDFVLIDATRTPFRATPELLARLTDRHFGVGCDQVLVIEPASTPDVDFDYRIYNSDGSEAGQCGNGSRCFARYVHDHGLSNKDVIRVRTITSVLELHRLEGGLVRVNMGVPKLEPLDIPFNASPRAERYELRLDNGTEVEFGVANMGNPHAVLEVADVDSAAVEEIGQAIQRNRAFPESVNVGFLQVHDAGHASLRVYERGAGETLACGTGACGAVVVGRLWGRLSASVDVQVRGGALKIEWQGEGQPVWMTGPAETVFSGEIEWPN